MLTTNYAIAQIVSNHAAILNFPHAQKYEQIVNLLQLLHYCYKTVTVGITRFFSILLQCYNKITYNEKNHRRK